MGDLIQWKGHSLHISKNIYPCATCKKETYLIELDTQEPFCSRKCMDIFLEKEAKRIKQFEANLHRCEDCQWARLLNSPEQLEGGEELYQCVNPHEATSICGGTMEHWCAYFE